MARTRIPSVLAAFARCRPSRPPDSRVTRLRLRSLRAATWSVAHLLSRCVVGGLRRIAFAPRRLPSYEAPSPRASVGLSPTGSCVLLWTRRSSSAPGSRRAIARASPGRPPDSSPRRRARRTAACRRGCARDAQSRRLARRKGSRGSPEDRYSPRSAAAPDGRDPCSPSRAEGGKASSPRSRTSASSVGWFAFTVKT